MYAWPSVVVIGHMKFETKESRYVYTSELELMKSIKRQSNLDNDHEWHHIVQLPTHDMNERTRGKGREGAPFAFQFYLIA
jgi:hypothetical protein